MTILLSLAVAAGVAACGGSGASDVVATVGGTAITKPQVNHWMSTLLGGDYYEIIAHTVPQGLVAEPPAISICATNLKAIAPAFSSEQLTHRCQQLNSLVREQAVMYLLDAAVSTEENAELGVTVEPQEVTAAFNGFRKESFPTEAELREYLEERRWSLADELFVEKKDVQGTKRLQKVREKLGAGASEAAIAAYYRDLASKWIAKTSCHPGYVVMGCRQYKAPETPATISPAIVIEEIAKER